MVFAEFALGAAAPFSDDKSKSVQIGLPNPKLMEGMEAEHTRRPDSNDTFEPGTPLP